MSNIMDIVAEATNGKSYRTFKYCFESFDVPSFNYDDTQKITWSRWGETNPPSNKDGQNMKPLADKIINDKPLFSYFLDGSRRTYKVDDIAYNNQVYPVIAGQIGISCCTRKNRDMRYFDYQRKLAIHCLKQLVLILGDVLTFLKI